MTQNNLAPYPLTQTLVISLLLGGRGENVSFPHHLKTASPNPNYQEHLVKLLMNNEWAFHSGRVLGWHFLHLG